MNNILKTLILVGLFLPGCQVTPIIKPTSSYTKLSPTALPTPNDPTLMDRSIFSDAPCAKPCWHGLQPGLSTRSDVLRQVENLTFINRDTKFELSKGYYWDPTLNQNVTQEILQFNCKQPAETVCVGFGIVEDTLRYIMLYPNYPITIQNLVDKLGPPDFVSLFYDFSHAGPVCRNITFSWIHKQIQAHILLTDSMSKSICDMVQDKQGINRDELISAIGYVLPEAFSNMPRKGEDFLWPGWLNR